MIAVHSASFYLLRTTQDQPGYSIVAVIDRPPSEYPEKTEAWKKILMELMP